MHCPGRGFSIGDNMRKIINYFRDIRGEFSQITWPDRQTALRLTAAVVIFSAIFAGFLGAVDYFFEMGVRKLIFS